ncbi:hypothetical protein KFK09_002945 [Dendrobium nobile]|uniref:Uncharacterized protein n=1 Tax=Dendrobium nobile TaxID=94219 RepID=A0A8T3C6A9_DENNO|nr:hypothetical protein KFK09_002945 [Dendrobium nobile]
MGGSISPIEIGTQGTIGSLLSQEIEYFKKIDTNHHRSHQKSKKVIQDMASKSTGSFNKKKKQSIPSNNGGFLPCICSIVEIRNAGGAGYINLKTDCNKFMQD